LNYKEAKAKLRNIGYDDKSETVYMAQPDFITKVDWDSKNVDFVSTLYSKRICSYISNFTLVDSFLGSLKK